MRASAQNKKHLPKLAGAWWGAQRDSNPRSPDPQSGALTDYAMGTTYAPEGTRTPGPLLRRQLLYPPELRAHDADPKGYFYGATPSLGVCCERYSTTLSGFCQGKTKNLSGFSYRFIPSSPRAKPAAAPASTSRGEWTRARTRTAQTPRAAAVKNSPTGRE